jgi:hypothetical protein
MFVDDVRECAFYHVMELPGLGVVGQTASGWDLRKSVDTYLGHFEFGEKRVLDVGSASGYLTFEMERRGAEVVSFDLGDPDAWDIVPYTDSQHDLSATRGRYAALVQARIRAYWLAHRLLGSSARAFYGDVYRLPRALGTFQVAMLGMILGHLRDPFRALESITQLVEETVIITEQAPQIEGAYAHFMPDERSLGVDNAWWATSEECRRRMLGVLGFQEVSLEREEHFSHTLGAPDLCSTQVFRRVHPIRSDDPTSRL